MKWAWASLGTFQPGVCRCLARERRKEAQLWFITALFPPASLWLSQIRWARHRTSMSAHCSASVRDLAGAGKSLPVLLDAVQHNQCCVGGVQHSQATAGCWNASKDSSSELRLPEPQHIGEAVAERNTGWGKSGVISLYQDVEEIPSSICSKLAVIELFKEQIMTKGEKTWVL